MLDLLPFLGIVFLTKPVWMWLAFFAVILVLIVFDLGILHKKNQEIGIKESLWLSAFYISAGLLFGAWVWFETGADNGGDFITGFVVEKSLAMDNIFIIALIFNYFAVPRIYQHRVLFWGIIGVIVLRGVLIGFGSAVIEHFHWILYIFGVFIFLTGLKMIFTEGSDHDLSHNKVLKFLRKHFHITPQLHEDKFIMRLPVVDGGPSLVHLTPLFVALIMIEIADVVFALDSIPAIFAITTDPYVVFTSNIFAILGLRALFFALSALMARFTYLKYALALVLVFIGGKVLAEPLLGIEKIPSSISLAITLTILITGTAFSVWKTGRDGKIAAAKAMADFSKNQP